MTRGCDNVETDNKKTMLICCLLVLVVFACGWLLYRHYNAAGTSTGNNAINTVQSTERDNQSARHDINAATGEIESAQSELNAAGTDLDAATESVIRLQGSSQSDKKTISECNSLVESGRGNIEEARGIFEAVDSANKTDGASR